MADEEAQTSLVTVVVTSDDGEVFCLSDDPAEHTQLLTHGRDRACRMFATFCQDFSPVCVGVKSMRRPEPYIDRLY